MGKGLWGTHTELSLLVILTVAVAPFCPLQLPQHITLGVRPLPALLLSL